mmetsp:Transcript_44614/g.129782  ORF Transcript_44614/g.129782 Transcript_44614/m.129782 type:complete len:205 (-) Transcript_44614:228-842(-)
MALEAAPEVNLRDREPGIVLRLVPLELALVLDAERNLLFRVACFLLLLPRAAHSLLAPSALGLALRPEPLCLAALRHVLEPQALLHLAELPLHRLDVPVEDLRPEQAKLLGGQCRIGEVAHRTARTADGGGDPGALDERAVLLLLKVLLAQRPREAQVLALRRSQPHAAAARLEALRPVFVHAVELDVDLPVEGAAAPLQGLVL